MLHNRQFEGNGSNKGGDYDVDVGNDDDEDDVQFGIDDGDDGDDDEYVQYGNEPQDLV